MNPSKENTTVFYVSEKDDRCMHDIINNIYPCEIKEGEYVSNNNEN